jgi:hypothetical protein
MVCVLQRAVADGSWLNDSGLTAHGVCLLN